eukprot:11026244-Karenia_brevis.AAC.1
MQPKPKNHRMQNDSTTQSQHLPHVFPDNSPLCLWKPLFASSVPPFDFSDLALQLGRAEIHRLGFVPQDLVACLQGETKTFGHAGSSKEQL